VHQLAGAIFLQSVSSNGIRTYLDFKKSRKQAFALQNHFFNSPFSLRFVRQDALVRDGKVMIGRGKGVLYQQEGKNLLDFKKFS
jgi:hypothetical protein